jgi:hypothetical protein
MPAERRDFHEGFHALGHLAPPVRRDRIEQQRQEIGPRGAHPVVDRLDTDKQAVAALHRLTQAQRPTASALSV